ncbi:MAG: S-layer homology domain-containing protein [Candidatus Abawacabacteria bacterium]|nr:S-layer homology domain-containing protein [Candidatus Abawacabacteria bacterium]
MKKWLSWCTAFLVIISIVPQSSAALFPDVSSAHPNYTAIAFLRDRGVISGFPDGLYRPENAVTRGEILKILMRAAGETNLPFVSGDPFPDVRSNHVFAAYIQAAVQQGIVRGYDDGLFRMDRTVSRIEALKMLLLANHINTNALPSGSSYSDIVPGSWYVPYARYALDHGLVDAFPGNTIRRDELLNRGLVAEMVYRFYRDRPDLLPAVAIPSPTVLPTASSMPTPTVSPTAIISPTPTAISTPTASPTTPFLFPPDFTLPSTPLPVVSTPAQNVQISVIDPTLRCNFNTGNEGLDYSGKVWIQQGMEDNSHMQFRYYWEFGDGTFTPDMYYTYYHGIDDSVPEHRTFDLPSYHRAFPNPFMTRATVYVYVTSGMYAGTRSASDIVDCSHIVP